MRFALAVLALALTAAPAAAADWRTYVNDRFGVTADVPSDWRAGREPANGDGLVFTAPDGQATITISGGLQIEDDAEEAMKAQSAPGNGETITYQQRGAKWIVVSGTSGQRIFYRKSLLSCGDQIWNNVSIDYPAARKSRYDALVAHVAASLRSGRSAQIPDCR